MGSGSPTSLGIVVKVLDRRLDEADVEEAADEEDEHGDGVGAPEEGEGLVVLDLGRLVLHLEAGKVGQMIKLGIGRLARRPYPVVRGLEVAVLVGLFALVLHLLLDHVQRVVHGLLGPVHGGGGEGPTWK